MQDTQYSLHLDAAPAAESKPSMRALIAEVRAADQDHEFYPTTNAIIAALIAAIGPAHEPRYNRDRSVTSFLDIGAGNGKVLEAVRKGCGIDELYAIEKSAILTNALANDIMVIGTDFHEQSLLTKAVDVIFCNPPYSEYEEWSYKIIRESAAPTAYLVIPERWERSTRIADALKFREATTRKIGTFDFEDAEDRRARAHVHLLRVDFKTADRWEKNSIEDAFARFFDEQFAHLGSNESKSADEIRAERREKEDAQVKSAFSALVPGPSYPEALVNLYNEEMAKIQTNYKLVAALDSAVMAELKIFPGTIMRCLYDRLKNLKLKYWEELFSRLTTVTERLTSKSRRKLLETLQRHVQVDLTVPNICAVMVWVIKNANQFMDSQLVETYLHMVDKCNVKLYKSNHSAWVEDRWRGRDEPEKNSRYALERRIVTHRIGGIKNGYSFEKGLADTAAEFLGDLTTLANNLGFRCDEMMRQWVQPACAREWVSGATQTFRCLDREGHSIVLFDARAFLNGNMHIRFNPKFMLALNVEFGRLRGWLHNPSEAVSEMADPEAADYFKMNHQLCITNPGLLLTN